MMVHMMVHALTVPSVTFRSNSVKVCLVEYSAHDAIMVSDRAPEIGVGRVDNIQKGNDDDDENIRAQLLGTRRRVTTVAVKTKKRKLHELQREWSQFPSTDC
jgi:hypothetical protein